MVVEEMVKEVTVTTLRSTIENRGKREEEKMGVWGGILGNEGEGEKDREGEDLSVAEGQNIHWYGFENKIWRRKE